MGDAMILLGCVLWCGCATSAQPSVDERSAALVRKLGCPGCHDPGDGTLSGRSTPFPGTMAYAANLTPDVDTGLGGWSDAQIARAIRSGIDDQGEPLCPPMPQFGHLTDGDMTSVIAYLRALPPVRNEQVPPSLCPPIKGNDGDPALDLGEPLDAGQDLSETIDLLTPDDRSVDREDAGTTGSCLRLNELSTASSASSADEFVEIFNACEGAQPLGPATLVYRSASGQTNVTLLQLPTVALAAKGFFVAGGKNFSGHVDARFQSGLADSGGGVALVGADGAMIDSLGYGSAQNSFVRTAAAPAPHVDGSIARQPDGHDTGNNAADFRLAPRTPGMPNG